MNKTRILLLEPSGDLPSSSDQSLGARLAATEGPVRRKIMVEHRRFERRRLDDLERVMRSTAGKVSGVVGVTSVPESTRLGELAEELELLCFVANNNTAVWRGRRHVFHIGLPTPSTARAVAEALLRNLLVKRIFILHDQTEFQSSAASAAAEALQQAGAEIRSRSVRHGDWPDEIRSWKAELMYLVCSDEEVALAQVRAARQATPDTLLLVGRSLLRQTFFDALGKDANGLLLVDMFERGTARTAQERLFMEVLGRAGVGTATANHGFGWDAMTLCGLALETGGGEPLAAIEGLESGVFSEGVTGRFSFAPEDHNGRRDFNPTKLSRLWHGRLQSVGRNVQKVSQ